MQRTLGLLCALAVVLTTVSASADQKGQIVRSAEVFTSPGRYPIVGYLARGDAVKVASCNKDMTWCQIGTEKVRGWVLAGNVEMISRGKVVH